MIEQLGKKFVLYVSAKVLHNGKKILEPFPNFKNTALSRRLGNKNSTTSRGTHSTYRKAPHLFIIIISLSYL